MPAEETRGMPFSALIAASSLVVAALYLVGFSYRWSFYYNFGVPEIVFGLSFTSFLVASLELLRQPVQLAGVIGITIIATLLVESLVSLHRLAVKRQSLGNIWKFLATFGDCCGLKSSLAGDLLKALAIAYGLYIMATSMGYSNFLNIASGSAGEVFPAITLLDSGNDESALPLACGQSSNEQYRLIGDAAKIRRLTESHRTCSLGDRTWRLLFRDEKFNYLFESAPRPDAVRPLTLVIPATNKNLLILN